MPALGPDYRQLVSKTSVITHVKAARMQRYSPHRCWTGSRARREWLLRSDRRKDQIHLHVTRQRVHELNDILPKHEE